MRAKLSNLHFPYLIEEKMRQSLKFIAFPGGAWERDKILCNVILNSYR
jgi:hypothetical protein